MYLRSDQFVSHLMLTMSLVAALAIGWMATIAPGPDSEEARATVFAIVVVWAALELTTILLHGFRYGFDALSVSMGWARLSIMNYFGAMALNMGELVTVPGWWFMGSRIALAAACGAAAVFLAREAWWAFEELTRIGKVLMVLALALLAIAIIVLIISF